MDHNRKVVELPLDDILPNRIIIDINKLIYINYSFVNVNGALWNLRKQSFPNLN